MWLLFALICTFVWGGADLFYKKGADENDRYSHLKTAIWVGIIMGIHAVVLIASADWSYNFKNLLVYLPVSAMYILSMIVGYFGLRYLELSISSPVQNASGALVFILCLIFLKVEIDALSIVAVVLTCGGVFMLGLLEYHVSSRNIAPGESVFHKGFAAFMFPIIYCVLDAAGTFFDAYYLDDAGSTPLLGVTADNIEDVANASYELTFLIIAIILFIWLHIIKKQPVAMKKSAAKSRPAAALLETAGQYAYVYAMSGNGALAAPVVASYCVVSLILSRLFLKEKLSRNQYIAIGIVVAGIVLLGVAEGMESA